MRAASTKHIDFMGRFACRRYIGLMSERLPIVAEQMFSLLCGEAGVICNKSANDDSAGWDYIIHLPTDPNDVRPKDEQPGSESAFVQVKSTYTAPLTVQLKLSNALRMAKERQPYFIVLVVGGREARRIYARHFWAAEIENTLRRVRLAEVSGHRDRLNRRKLTLSFSGEDDHTENLLPWIQSTIRAVRGDYREAKAAIAESVGYGKDGTRISVTLKASPDEIIDWELGLRPTPAVSSFKLTRERFGIELPDPRIPEDAKVSIEPNGQACLITLVNRSEGGTITFAGKLFTSALALALPSHRPWRADFGCLALISRAGELRGGLSLDFGERVSAPVLLDRLTLASWTGVSTVSGTLFADGERSEIGTLSLSDRPVDVEGWKEVASWASTLRTISDRHPGSDPRISIDDLMKSGVWLKRFHRLFAGGSLRIEHNPNPDDDPTHAIIYRLRCNVGTWSFFAFIRRDVAVDTVKDGMRTLYLKPAELLEAFVMEGSWASNVERILPAYERHVRTMGDPTYFWEMGDMEEWIAKMSAENEAAPEQHISPQSQL